MPSLVLFCTELLPKHAEPGFDRCLNWMQEHIINRHLSRAFPILARHLDPTYQPLSFVHALQIYYVTAACATLCPQITHTLVRLAEHVHL